MWDPKASPEGFNKVFERNLMTSKTYKGAYEETEKLHESAFGQRRYSCYQAFRNSRGNILRKK